MAKTHSTMQARRAHWYYLIRKARKLTQKQVATNIGVTTTAISQWERAQGDPSLDNFQALLNELQCWHIDVLADPGRPTPPPRPQRDHINGSIAPGMSIQLVIDEFAQPSHKPEEYPPRMRCWICHGRPGECQCYEICKVCGLPFPKGRKCSTILH
jgi:transcriptional regulator with XRE-family HTH domain